MLLHTTITSERGKPVTKSGNEYINVSILNDKREEIFNLTLKHTGLYQMTIDKDLLNIDDIPM